LLMMDPLDSGVVAPRSNLCQGVTAWRDRTDPDGGSRAYYVSFNNVEVGKMIGQGLVSCIASWKVAKPQVVVMHGAATDNNATLFAQGYDAVLKPYFSSGKWTDVVNTAGTWDPPTAETEFQEAYTAHPTINAAVIPTTRRAPHHHLPPDAGTSRRRRSPPRGRTPPLVGLQNVLFRYQCGTVYKAHLPRSSSAAASPCT